MIKKLKFIFDLVLGIIMLILFIAILIGLFSQGDAGSFEDAYDGESGTCYYARDCDMP